MNGHKYIQFEQVDHIAVITLSRPKVLNALSRALLEELDEAITWVENSNETRALIITGAGEKAFVAGADIGELRSVPSGYEAEELALKGQAVFNRIENLAKPVIMAVNGFALGGGCELAMSGDIILAADRAKFGQPEVHLGVIPGYGGTQRLARLIGKNRAKYMCMTGEMIDAEEAYRLGLVQKVIPAAELIDEAKKLAKTLAQKAPLALRYIKKSIHTGVEVDLKTGLEMEAAFFGLTFDSEDRKEGMDAFVEKRAARFTGK
ncbi:enoyl-CoA hydratase/isomerase family protein [Hazenella sp. IB182357]|uniref:Enoyl-CoA hydratase/isomerase family protein n=1 Tax=Polycladospora coralii TaxID=2771432 RepID=A0A926N9B0_9BACL|nr:enoyl-CoA hydratase-related protein [Polycladospora coralii]MBD1372202.1 enoyl-CoA hydratase/isomerase family protein [Polycladospora coralii]MBS7530701.1 enoyl-CoA hydratase/isomerase family protein [Polycladospora coralii]